MWWVTKRRRHFNKTSHFGWIYSETKKYVRWILTVTRLQRLDLNCSDDVTAKKIKIKQKRAELHRCRREAAHHQDYTSFWSWLQLLGVRAALTPLHLLLFEGCEGRLLETAAQTETFTGGVCSISSGPSCTFLENSAPRLHYPPNVFFFYF